MTPDHVQLAKADILNHPVTNYCANLIVFDESTGAVRFPHPSVKTFLCDSTKVPSELSYLGLTSVEDCLWCGRICLAHVKIHHSRNGVVPFRCHEVSTSIASPIIKSMFGSVLPLRKGTNSKHSKGAAVRLPVPVANIRQAPVAADLTLHSYMCKYWLDHNISISDDLSHYEDFADLCLSSPDPDIHPWATSNILNIDHYRGILQHAILTNHAALLRLLEADIRGVRRERWRVIFQQYVPGTGTTYLHYAAALGNLDAVKVLLDVYQPSVSDADGRSAAYIALKAQHIEVLRLIAQKDPHVSWTGRRVLCPLPAEIETVRRFERNSSTFGREDLGGHCVLQGDLNTLSVLLGIDYRVYLATHNSPWAPAHLSRLFFEACRLGHLEIAELLAEYGPEVDSFDLEDVRIHSVYVSSWYSSWPLQNHPKRIPAMQAALELDNITMMKSLLTLKALGVVHDEDCDLLHVVLRFGGDRRRSEPFVLLFSEHGRTIDRSIRATGKWKLWWLEILIQEPNLSHKQRDQCIRFILQTSYASPAAFARSYGHCPLPGPIEPLLFNRWLSYTADDVLVCIAALGRFSLEFLVSESCLRAALSRGTSRFLESIRGIMTLPRRRFGFPMPLSQGNTTGMADILKRPEATVTVALANAIDEDRVQIVDFVACCSVDLTLPLQAQQEYYQKKLHEVTMAEEKNVSAPPFPRLMWFRCLQKMKGDVAAAEQLCSELMCVRGTGNFALNGASGDSSSHQCVWLALHAWNFRLNRARKRPYSESDVWYIAAALKWWMKSGRGQSVPSPSPDDRPRVH